jgi:nicotinamidase-related amidase
MSKSIALLIVDVQNGFITDETKDVPAHISHHIRHHSYDQLLFSQFINQPGSNYERLIDVKSCYGAPETDIHPDLAEFVTSENVFVKHGKSAFKNQDLLRCIKTAQIDQLDICGLDIDDCVLATAFEAFDLNLNFRVLDDLCGSSHGQDHIHSSAHSIITKNLSPKQNKL